MDVRCEGRLTNRKSELVRDNWQQRRLQNRECNTAGIKRPCVGTVEGTAIVYMRRATRYHIPEGIVTQTFRRLNIALPLVAVLSIL